MTSYAGLHEKSVTSVTATFSISYPCSRAAWHTTSSYDFRVSVIATADLWSFSTINRDWAVASNGDLFEFPKIFDKWKLLEGTAIILLQNILQKLPCLQ